jgi:DNA gyrase subunit A
MMELTTRKYTSLLKREQDRLEVQEGLIRAVDIIDLIIEILRGSPNVKEAKACLMGQPAKVTFKSEESRKMAGELHFTEKQAQAILDLRLARLIGLEILALQKEYKETKKKISRYRKILGSDAEKRAVCIEELTRIRDKYAVPRRTLITDCEQAHDVVEEVKEQEVVFAMDRFGYSRVLDVPVYERNKDSVDKDSVWLFRCMNTDRVRVFTDKGQVHQVKVADIPLVKAKEKGIPIDNLCNYDSSKETFIYVCPAAGSTGGKLLFCTKMGYVKIVPAEEFESAKRTVMATKLSAGDSLVCVTPQTDSQVVLRTQNGYFLRFPLSEVSELKKNSIGVKGITLGADDYVKACVPVQPNKDSLVPCSGDVTVEATRIKLGKRAGKGIKLKL